MALVVYTQKPKALLDAIYQAIDEKHIVTWLYDKDGDFTHEPQQWRHRAWLRPNVLEGVLQFGLLGQNKVTMKKSVYGVYHGRFIEMLLTHFDNDFTNMETTAQAEVFVDDYQTA